MVFEHSQYLLNGTMLEGGFVEGHVIFKKYF